LCESIMEALLTLASCVCCSNTTTKVSPARCAIQNGIDNVLTDCIDCASASAYVVELEGKNSLVSVGMCSP
jgi:hypothetical protein